MPSANGRKRKASQHGEVGGGAPPTDTPDAEERETVVVLKISERALHGAATVKAAPLVGLAQDARFAVATVLPERDDGHDAAFGVLTRRLKIAHRAAGSRVVRGHRLPETRCLGDPDIAWNHRLDHQLTEVLPDLCGDLVG